MRVFKYTQFLLVGMALLISTTTSTTAETRDFPPFSTKVCVMVGAEDYIRGKIDSYIKRELRSLSDVTLVDEGADWKLSILAMEPSTRGGGKGGVVISWVILKPFNNQWLSTLFQDGYKELGLTLTDGLCREEDHLLKVGPSEELRSMCEEMVADFDSDYIEPERKSYREAMKSIKKKD